MNICAFTGRLVRDPETKDTKNGGTMGRYTIAVSRDEKHVDGVPDADFIDVKVFNKAAEFAANYLKKGTKVEVCGPLRIDKWQSNDGVWKTSVYVLASRQGFAESRKASEEAAPVTAEAPKPVKPKRRPAPPIPTGTQEPLPPDDDFQQISSDEDLPF